MKRRWFLWLFIVVIILGVGTAVTLWNKPHAKAEDAASTKITAVGLSKIYAANEQAADSLYLSKETDKKALEVTGTVAKIDKNQDGGVMLILDSGDPMTGVQCTMREKNIHTTQGQNVTVKGFCSGSGITGVTLTDCILK